MNFIHTIEYHTLLLILQLVLIALLLFTEKQGYIMINNSVSSNASNNFKMCNIMLYYTMLYNIMLCWTTLMHHVHIFYHIQFRTMYNQFYRRNKKNIYSMINTQNFEYHQNIIKMITCILNDILRLGLRLKLIDITM